MIWLNSFAMVKKRRCLTIHELRNLKASDLMRKTL
jgi:hypothetical protein